MEKVRIRIEHWVKHIAGSVGLFPIEPPPIGIPNSSRKIYRYFQFDVSNPSVLVLLQTER